MRQFSPALALLLPALALPAAAQGGATSFDFITIGDPGNIGYNGIRPHPDHFDLSDRGSVDYEFRVSRNEVTTGQWLEFYNSYASFGDEFDLRRIRPSSWGATLDLSSRPRYRLLLPSQVADASKSRVNVSWLESAMYINWLHNGQVSTLENLFDGAYDLRAGRDNPDVLNTMFIEREPDARYWMPNIDEYMKLAYYDPDKNGEGPGWWQYAHQSEEPPTHGLPGEGDVARELTPDQIRELTGGSSSFIVDIPLDAYADITSAYGVQNLLGGNSEWLDDPSGVRPDEPSLRVLAPGRDGTELIAPEIEAAWDFFNREGGVSSPRGSFHVLTTVPSPGAGALLGVVVFSSFTRTRR